MSRDSPERSVVVREPEVGRRPYPILSREEAIPVLNRALAVPATRTIRHIPTAVELHESDAMPTHCALTLDSVAAIRLSLCTERLTRLGPDRMHEIWEALRHATAC